MEKLVVIGGGVAGWATACALRPLDPVLYAPPDRSDLSVVLWARGLRALRRLGVQGVASIPLQTIRYRSSTGRVLQSVDLRSQQAVLVQKSAIAGALAGCAELEAQEAMVSGVRRVDRGFALAVPGADTCRTHALVGADGAMSLVRKSVVRGSAGGMVPGLMVVGHHDRVPENPSVVDMFFGASAFLGVMPRLDATGDAIGTSFWLFLPEAPPIMLETLDTWKQMLEPVFCGFGAFASYLVPQEVPWFRRAPQLPRFQRAGAPRVALVGDAWRAATPELGLGVTWALEDAVRLGEHVDKHGLIMGLSAYARDSIGREAGPNLARDLHARMADPKWHWCREAGFRTAAPVKLATSLLSGAW